MITSYLVTFTIRSSESIPQNHAAHLFDLIGLGLCPFGLEIQNLIHARLSKDVVTTTNPLVKPQVLQQSTQTGKGNVCIRSAKKNPV